MDGLFADQDVQTSEHLDRRTVRPLEASGPPRVSSDIRFLGGRPSAPMDGPSVGGQMFGCPNLVPAKYEGVQWSSCSDVRTCVPSSTCRQSARQMFGHPNIMTWLQRRCGPSHIIRQTVRLWPTSLTGGFDQSDQHMQSPSKIKDFS